MVFWKGDQDSTVLTCLLRASLQRLPGWSFLQLLPDKQLNRLENLSIPNLFLSDAPCTQTGCRSSCLFIEQELYKEHMRINGTVLLPRWGLI